MTWDMSWCQVPRAGHMERGGYPSGDPGLQEPVAPLACPRRGRGGVGRGHGAAQEAGLVACPRGSSSWRARKRHRAQAHEWIQATNSALKVSCGIAEGWARYQQPADLVARAEPLDGLVISAAAGRGADGRAAAAYLQRVPRINMELLRGPSHDTSNDFNSALRRADVWSFNTLLLACYNVQHGP